MSTPHLGHSVVSSGISAPHLGHIWSLVSATSLKSSLARNSVLSPSANWRLAGTFLTARRTGVLPPLLSPFSADDSPAGILTRVSHAGHFTAFPRAVSGAFNTFSPFAPPHLTPI